MSTIAYKSATISNIKKPEEIPYATTAVPGIIRLAEDIENYTDATGAVTPALMQPVLADITNRITYSEAGEQFLSKTTATSDYLTKNEADAKYVSHSSLLVRWENNNFPAGTLEEYEYIDGLKVVWAISDNTFAAQGITLSDIFVKMSSTFIGSILVVIKNTSSSDITCVISDTNNITIVPDETCLINCFCLDGTITAPVKVSYP